MSGFARQCRPGFSVTELVVVVALLAVGLCLLLPAVLAARQADDRVKCEQNLKIIALSIHNAHDSYGKLPPTVGSFPDTGTNSQGTLFFFILPFLEEGSLYQTAHDGRGLYVWHKDVYGKAVKHFLCPSDTSAPAEHRYENWLATSNYAANYLVFGSTNGGGTKLTDLKDGTSNTMIITERFRVCNGHPCAWGYPALYYWAPIFAHYSQGKFQQLPSQKQCDAGLPQSPHKQGIHAAMGDGSVRTVASSISPQTWWQACTPSGGEGMNKDW